MPRQIKLARPRRKSTLSALPALLLTLTLGCQPTALPETQTATDASHAEQLVAEGRNLWATRQAPNLVEALAKFQQAAELQPASGAAWAGIADASALIGLYALVPADKTMPQAFDAANRALELNPLQGRTWGSLGLVQYLYKWDFVAAEAAFGRALEIEPNNHDVHHWLAMMLSVLGRHQEAFDHIDVAAALKPTSPLLATKVGTIRAAANDLVNAEALLLEAQQRFPTFTLAQRELGFLRLRQHRLNDATEHFRLALGVPRTADAQINQHDWLAKGNTKTLGALAHTYGRLGQRAAALKLIQALKERSATETVPSMVLAHALLGLDETDSARLHLEQALTERDPGLVYVFTKAGYERLPADQLTNIVQRIGPIAPFGQ